MGHCAFFSLFVVSLDRAGALTIETGTHGEMYFLLSFGAGSGREIPMSGGSEPEAESDMSKQIEEQHRNDGPESVN